MEIYKKKIFREGLLWAVFFIFIIFLVSSIKSGSMLSGDNLLKIIQAKSLLVNAFGSEALYYPAEALDPGFRFYPYQDIMLVPFQSEFLGVFPIFYAALISPVVSLLGPQYVYLVSLIFFILIFVLFRYGFHFSISTVLFAIFGTYIITFAMDGSENSLVFFLVLAGTILIYRGFEQNDLTPLLSGGFIMGLSIFFRMEAVLYMGSMLLVKLILNRQQFWPAFKHVILAGLAFAVPVMLFMAFNYADYGHPLGPRFTQNFEADTGGLVEQLRRMVVLLFAGYLKIGFFLYLPLFLIVLVFYARPKFLSTLHANEKVSFYTTILFLFLTAALAPNDGGVNIGPRYLALAMIPFLHLTDRYWKDVYSGISIKDRIGWKLMAMFAIGFSVMITLAILAMKVAGSRAAHVYQNQMVESSVDLWIMDHTTCNTIGLKYFEKPSLCIHNNKNLDTLIKRLQKQMSGKRIAYFQAPGRSEQMQEARSFCQKKPDDSQNSGLYAHWKEFVYCTAEIKTARQKSRAAILASKECKQMLDDRFLLKEKNQFRDMLISIYRIP